MTNTLLIKNGAAGRPLKDIPNQLNQCASDLGRGVMRVWHAYRAYRERRAARTRLMAIDDHVLKDIGLDRSEIDSVLPDTSRTAGVERARRWRRGAPFFGGTHSGGRAPEEIARHKRQLINKSALFAAKTLSDGGF